MALRIYIIPPHVIFNLIFANFGHLKRSDENLNTLQLCVVKFLSLTIFLSCPGKNLKRKVVKIPTALLNTQS